MHTKEQIELARTLCNHVACVETCPLINEPDCLRILREGIGKEAAETAGGGDSDGAHGDVEGGASDGHHGDVEDGASDGPHGDAEGAGALTGGDTAMDNAIVRALPRAERLAMLAEECAELGHAALKLRRAIDGENPTPVTIKDSEAAFLEEVADVLLALTYCTNQIYDISASDAICERCEAKLERWKARLAARGGEA